MNLKNLKNHKMMRNPTASKARRYCKKKNKKFKKNKKINVLDEAPAEAVARKRIKIIK